MATGHVLMMCIQHLQFSILKTEGKIVHAESSGITSIHVGKLLSCFAWPVPVTLLRVNTVRTKLLEP